MGAKKKVVIIGGVAGGANVAARLRRLDEQADIVMLERGEYVSFANCGLPYHIGGEIADRQKLLLHTPDSLYQRFRIDVRIQSTAVSIDRERKVVKVRSLKGEEYEESYDTLVLSPGASPLRPNIPGLNLEGILTLRDIRDMDTILQRLSESHPRRISFVGGGFIGLELMEQIAHRFPEKSLTLIESSPHILAPLDYEMVAPLENLIRERNVELVLDDPVISFEKLGDSLAISTRSGRQTESDLVFFSIGVRPEVSLAKDAGLEIGARGGIRVDSQMRTNDPNIFALGDCIETKHLITGEEQVIPLAGPANRQGRIVADVIHGLDSHYKGTLGTAIVRVFDTVAAVTGANERTLSRLGMKFQAIYLHPSSHASYYPGASPVRMKVLFNPETGRILGAQAIGKEGVDKRIDVIATAISSGLGVDELHDLELCYAPPFSSAKDPVNLAGMIAENARSGLVESISPAELPRELPAGTLIDVRELAERQRGSIPGSIHIPLGELRDRLSEIPKEHELFVFCQSGQRSYNACRILAQHGYRCKNISGAYLTWSAFTS